MRPTVYTSRPRDSYPARLLRAFLSAIIPGLGQLLAGVRRRGFFLLAIFVVVTVAAIIILTRGTDAIVGWALQPRVLLTLLVIDIVVMLVRMFAVVDAWLTAKAGSLKPARPSGPRMLLTGALLALILVFTVAPHVVAGYYTLVSHRLLTTVFTGNTTTTQKPNGSPGSTSSGTSGSNPGSQSSDTTATTAAAESLNWGTDGRMTVLLIGTDAGFGRTGARADSMNIATIDIKTGRVAMFGLPRNTGNTPLGSKTSKALGMKTYPDLLNSLYTAGLKHPEIAPDGDSGAEAVRETASLILGIQIDYYAVVNMMGLVDMVNALGGIDVNLKTALHITYAPLNAGEEKKSYVFNVGVNHLDGLKALAYARDRSDSDDYVRMGRQRCVIMAMLYQNSVTSLTLHFPAIASALEKSVRTNMPLGALADVVKLRSKVKTSNMITLGFTPPDWVSGYVSGTNVLDFPKVKAAVKSIVTDPDAWIAAHPAVTTTGGASDCWKVTD
jgi:polyisoprenyl-teichoic acid--peptidoglycan teichoic acid transferase